LVSISKSCGKKTQGDVGADGNILNKYCM